jgi:predicted MFS family arabinose efflux permease
VLSAIREGIRYARHAPALRAVFVRTGLLVPFASALWALLPILARHEIKLNCHSYGILFGCLGMGAVVGALFLPQLRSRFSTDSLVAGATIVFAAVTAGLAELRHFELLCLVMIAGGIAWFTLMSSFNLATQMAAPSWIRARALALYLLIFHGGMAAGSVLWGAVTEHAGIPVALLVAAVGLIVNLVAVAWYPLGDNKQSDFVPSAYQPDRAVERTRRLSISAGPVPPTTNDRYAPVIRSTRWHQNG